MSPFLIPLRRSLVFPLRHLYRSRTIYRHQSTKPYYITTPIFYPNAAPHIGHLYSLVTADTFARFARLVEPGRDVHFLTGTDEHGLKIQRAANERGIHPRQLCDELSAQFRVLAEKAESSHSIFMRTSSESHKLVSQYVWRELDKRGLIYKSTYEGWYAVTDEAFYPASSVILPTSPMETHAISKETGAKCEWTSETNYMFRLSAFRDALRNHYTENPDAIFPRHAHEHVLQMLEGDLEDLSISRPKERLSWGVGVPGDENQTMYVWFDALLNYLSGIGYPGASEPQIWPANMQIIGKDILRFHAIYLPAILIALGLPLSKRILSHAHWTAGQKKMSKSIGNVVDPLKTIDIHGVDVVRYYLARVGGRYRDDVDWSEEQLLKFSDEARSYLGNYLLRSISPKILSLTSQLSASEKAALITNKQEGELSVMRKGLGVELKGLMEKNEVAEALDRIVEMLRLGNLVMTDTAPWSASPEVAYQTCSEALETLRVAGVCLQPFVPGVAGRLLDALRIPVHERGWAHAEQERAIEPQQVDRVKLFKPPPSFSS